MTDTFLAEMKSNGISSNVTEVLRTGYFRSIQSELTYRGMVADGDVRYFLDSDFQLSPFLTLRIDSMFLIAPEWWPTRGLLVSYHLANSLSLPQACKTRRSENRRCWFYIQNQGSTEMADTAWLTRGKTLLQEAGIWLFSQFRPGKAYTGRANGVPLARAFPHPTPEFDVKRAFFYPAESKAHLVDDRVQIISRLPGTIGSCRIRLASRCRTRTQPEPSHQSPVVPLPPVSCDVKL
jgi:hypothetical protein